MFKQISSFCFIILTIVALSGCSSITSFRVNVDVSGNVDNSEKVVDFANKIKNKKESVLEITSTTIEGKKVTSKYEYNGKDIKYTITYPKNNDKPIICSSINKEEKSNSHVYNLVKCDGEKRLTLIEIKKGK